MLTHLSIKNLAIITQLDLSFERGMSVITGESGAGKSIILQALNLALGGRSDATLVRKDTKQIEITASFEIIKCKKIQEYLELQSLTADNECILRRIINADGRSKAFINNVNVPLSILRAASELLIDLHGQNEHQLLLRPEQQLQLLDAYANTDKLCAEINQIVKKYNDINTKINALELAHQTQKQQQELLSYQLKELEECAFDAEEINNIEAQFKTSANAATLISSVSNIVNQLDSEAGVNNQLLQLNNKLSQVQNIEKKLQSATKLLITSQVQAQECIYELNNYLSNTTIDAQNTNELEQRLSELHDLSRKHNCEIEQLLETKQQIKSQLDKIDNDTNLIDELAQQKLALKNIYDEKATQLSTLRAQKSQKLSSLTTDAMQVLGMPGSEFTVELINKNTEVALNGAETVNFLIQTNTGQDFKPLKKIASGGELSRISLAISVVSSNNEYIPTLIFDEVDVGISGSVAQIVGRKLKKLSENYQVICITHLAQVAATGHQHLKISKTQTDNDVKITIENLSTQNKITEIARILGGINITDKTLKVAEEMLNETTA